MLQKLRYTPLAEHILRIYTRLTSGDKNYGDIEASTGGGPILLDYQAILLDQIRENGLTEKNNFAKSGGDRYRLVNINGLHQALVEYYVARSAPPPVSDAMSNGKVFPEIVKSLRGYLTENKMPEFDFSDWTMSGRILQGNRN